MKPLHRIAFIGNYLPRRCGIATFTHDLHVAVIAARPTLDSGVVAMTDRGGVYAYPEAVRFEVRDNVAADYVKAAEFLNDSGFEVVSLQHEFGIFGGDSGSYVLELLSRLKMPIVTTLHSILADPTPSQHAIVARIAEVSTTLIVMAEKGRNLLSSVYDVPDDKIEVIAHGIPDFPFIEPDGAKAKLGFVGKTVILTFGLLSPGKGIESVIEAMPEVIRSCPDAVYVILGATHPNLLRDHGETYRQELMARAVGLGVADHVTFINQFVDQPTLLDFISMCDLYVTPYLNEAQMTSGTLAYSFGLGKAVVSTPYWHALELLAGERGVIVPFGDVSSIGAEISGLLTDDVRRMAMRKRAYAASRSMTWPQTGKRYLATFERARLPVHSGAPLSAVLAKSTEVPIAMPPIRIGHLLAMCDSTGLLQHAIHSVPDRSHGYCVDDNARALLLACAPRGIRDPRMPDEMTARFAAFIQHAWNPDTGRFRNFMSYSRMWLEPTGSEDSHGRTLWALGICARDDTDPSRRQWAARLFATALPVVQQFTSPRAWTFALLGLDAYCQVADDDHASVSIRGSLADRLLAMLETRKLQHWPAHWYWFEDVLGYDNARLPQALIQTGLTTQTPAYVEAGIRSLRWLTLRQTGPTGYFQPVGTQSFGRRFQEPTAFDQQPVEAAATISACLAAARADGSADWLAEAQRAFGWFMGSNVLQTALVDRETGSCLDGLHPDRPNGNMGAESVLSYLLGLTEIREYERKAAIKGTNKSVTGVESRATPLWTPKGGRQLDTIQILEPTFATSAPRSGAGRRAAVQTGNGATRPQSHGQDQS